MNRTCNNNDKIMQNFYRKINSYKFLPGETNYDYLF